MPYPIRLLPNLNSKLILTPNGKEHLCRWTNPQLSLKDKFGQLNPMAIEEKRLFHYSTNKIPKSEIEDVFIDFYDKDRFLAPWNQNLPLIEVTDADYKMEVDRGYFFIPINEINDFIGSYPFPVDIFPDNYSFSVKVVHVPLRANIEHYELHVFDNEGNLLSELKKKNGAEL